MPEIDGTAPGLTVKEWLQRIEDGVLRVETKLDTKAEKAEVAALESRLRLIESLGTEQSRKAEININSLAKDVASLKVKVFAILGATALLATVLEVIRQGVLHT